jgi:hypothetical protein
MIGMNIVYFPSIIMNKSRILDNIQFQTILIDLAPEY